MTVDSNQIQDRLKELAERQWDADAIRGRAAKLLADGIRPKRLKKTALLADRVQIYRPGSTACGRIQFSLSQLS